jgi:hypothetical protein
VKVPFVPQVHNERNRSTTTAPSENQQQGMRGKLIESILQIVVQAITGIFTPGGLGAAFTQLTNWATNTVNSIYDIIDAIVNAFEGIPIFGPLVGGVWNVISGLLGIGNNAQATSTSNAGEIAAIKAGLAAAGSGGVSITEDFDRPVATSLGAGWTQTYSGAGAGTEGLDGLGNAHWAASGGAVRTVINISTTALTSNTQYASFVLRQKNVNSTFGGNHARRSLLLRSNTAGTTYVQVELTSETTATLRCVVSGTTVLSTNATGLTTKPGDFWELFAGDASDDYHIYAKLNGVTVLNLVDSGHLSAVGPSNLKVGFGGWAGIAVNLIIFLVQYSPPDVAAFGAADGTG